VQAGEVPGILAYDGERPVGWCSLGPREAFPRLERSRNLKAVDDRPVWSVVCFFVDRSCRRRGVSQALLLAAVEYARSRGARLAEGYPTDPGTKRPDPSVYTGLVPAFRKAGFVEVLRRSERRPIMRRETGR
jgi:GNAT superfamily N-acetyltransferase